MQNDVVFYCYLFLRQFFIYLLWYEYSELPPIHHGFELLNVISLPFRTECMVVKKHCKLYFFCEQHKNRWNYKTVYTHAKTEIRKKQELRLIDQHSAISSITTLHRKLPVSSPRKLNLVKTKYYNLVSYLWHQKKFDKALPLFPPPPPHVLCYNDGKV